jgi:hypothetical protein
VIAKERETKAGGCAGLIRSAVVAAQGAALKAAMNLRSVDITSTFNRRLADEKDRARRIHTCSPADNRGSDLRQ